jgi:uncharacterized membrane protein
LGIIQIRTLEQTFKFYYNKLTNKLWFRPLISCLLSIAAALLAQLADNSFIVEFAPAIDKSSLENLLTTISASMLVIAIFAVGSMLSAFSAASGIATPRSFELIVADDVSQNALSVYIGSFIFSIVAAVALKNGYYGQAGIFTLFVLTIIVFVFVILTFLRWVERISKLGRLEHTIKKVEEATFKVLNERKQEPYMGGSFISNDIETGLPVFSDKIGYVQYINVERLQELATEINATIIIKCIPGTFTSANKPLVYVDSSDTNLLNLDEKKLIEAFTIDNSRSFYDDPRFGIIALSEIAGKALSPGINDPGTAIAIIGSYVRLFTFWVKEIQAVEPKKIKYDRIKVPAISLADLFDDAFRPIARDGADNLELMIRLQKALISIAYAGDAETKALATTHSRQAFERAELAMEYKEDLSLLKEESMFYIDK